MHCTTPGLQATCSCSGAEVGAKCSSLGESPPLPAHILSEFCALRLVCLHAICGASTNSVHASKICRLPSCPSLVPASGLTTPDRLRGARVMPIAGTQGAGRRRGRAALLAPQPKSQCPAAPDSGGAGGQTGKARGAVPHCPKNSSNRRIGVISVRGGVPSKSSHCVALSVLPVCPLAMLNNNALHHANMKSQQSLHRHITDVCLDQTIGYMCHNKCYHSYVE